MEVALEIMTVSCGIGINIADPKKQTVPTATDTPYTITLRRSHRDFGINVLYGSCVPQPLHMQIMIIIKEFIRINRQRFMHSLNVNYVEITQVFRRCSIETMLPRCCLSQTMLRRLQDGRCCHFARHHQVSSMNNSILR